MQHSIVNYSSPLLYITSSGLIYLNSKLLPFNWNHVTQIGTWTQTLELETSQNHIGISTQGLLTEITPGLRTWWSSGSWYLMAERIQWETQWQMRSGETHPTESVGHLRSWEWLEDMGLSVFIGMGNFIG